MHFFQSQSIQRYLKASRKKEFLLHSDIPIFSKALSICLLCVYENDEQIAEIIETVKRYEGNQKRIRILVYVPLKKNPPILQDSLFIDTVLKTDITFWGKLKSNLKRNLWSYRYDLLINANYQSNNIITNLLSLTIKANFKITRSEAYPHIYHLNLQMKEEDSLSHYIDTIEKYTNKLNGK
ncbi:MAG TPA: hypothetical protein PLF32_04390 [Bacteroidales bacterium]|jgi:hypothetical protein|nr:hypothetical protein [Bacteroidales bacterium]HOR81871.1 hypothetical protein [Bacteroidales bacterium]HPJ91668.1 hypothetical protein [Bacteroidales bacterium]HPX59295.1 hypothetical protein [Bacteroidales bacterium]HQB19913.1 hypothetical protein [Bacteroidales bacterium]